MALGFLKDRFLEDGLYKTGLYKRLGSTRQVSGKTAKTGSENPLSTNVQWGSNGAPMGEMGENNLSDFLDFRVFLIICFGFFLGFNYSNMAN